mgnify:CR=1 FL=1
MADTFQVKTNGLNSIHLSGKVVDVSAQENGTRRVTISVNTKKSGNGKFNINCKVPDGPKVPVKDEFIHVFGNLRYSEDKQTYKVIASNFSYIGDSEINLVYLEMTLLDRPNANPDGSYNLTMSGFNISKVGQVFTLPIVVVISKQQYMELFRMLRKYSRYFIEGSIYKDGKELKVSALHIKSADGIMFDIPINPTEVTNETND